MSMATKRRCSCRCHNEARGNYDEARQYGKWDEALFFSRSPILNVNVPVDADDPIEAAVAQGCSCLGAHVIALSSHPEWHGEPWSLEKEAKEKEKDRQADGESGEELP